MTEDQLVTEGGGRISVTVWTSARSGPQWKVRLSEEADDELADVVVARAVRAFNRVGQELAEPRRPLRGEEPEDE